MEVLPVEKLRNKKNIGRSATWSLEVRYFVTVHTKLSSGHRLPEIAFVWLSCQRIGKLCTDCGYNICAYRM